LKFFLITQ